MKYSIAALLFILVSTNGALLAWDGILMNRDHQQHWDDIVDGNFDPFDPDHYRQDDTDVAEASDSSQDGEDSNNND